MGLWPGRPLGTIYPPIFRVKARFDLDILYVVRVRFLALPKNRILLSSNGDGSMMAFLLSMIHFGRVCAF
jgi:hypothetical protein